MNFVIKSIGFYGIFIATSLLIISLLFILNLFFTFPTIYIKYATVICVVLCLSVILLLIMKLIFSLLYIEETQKIEPIWYVIINRICFAVFVLYFVTFLIQTRSIERGSYPYMKLMFPGILPLFSSTAIDISKYLLFRSIN